MGRQLNDIIPYSKLADFSYIFKNKIIPIVYINLEAAVKRNEMFVQNCEKANNIIKESGFQFNIHRFDAVNITNSTEKIPPLNSQHLGGRTRAELGGELGCLVSHIRAIQYAHTLGYENCIISEDDADISILATHLTKFLHTLQYVPRDTGILQLVTHGDVYNRVSIIRRFNECWSTAMYLITKQGIKDVLSTLLPNNIITFLDVFVREFVAR